MQMTFKCSVPGKPAFPCRPPSSPTCLLPKGTLSRLWWVFLSRKPTSLLIWPGMCWFSRLALKRLSCFPCSPMLVRGGGGGWGPVPCAAALRWLPCHFLHCKSSLSMYIASRPLVCGWQGRFNSTNSRCGQSRDWVPAAAHTGCVTLDNGFNLAKAQSSLLLIRATNGNGVLRTKWGDVDEVPCTVPGNGEHLGNVSNHGSCHLARGQATRAVASPTTPPAWPVPSTCLWLGVSARNSLFTTHFTYTWLSDQWD